MITLQAGTFGRFFNQKFINSKSTAQRFDCALYLILRWGSELFKIKDDRKASIVDL
jgi:hypothetical protein